MKQTIIAFTLLLSSWVCADAPEILTDALNAYVDEGPEQFLPTLLVGSPLEGEKSVLSQSNMFNQIEAYYGKADSWEILAECSLTKRISTIYWVIYFEKGPMYGLSDIFGSPDGSTIVTRFLAHTEAAQIFPYTPVVKENICAG